MFALKDSAISARNTTYLVCNDAHSSLVCKYRFRCYRNRENHTERRTPPDRNVTLQDANKKRLVMSSYATKKPAEYKKVAH